MPQKEITTKAARQDIKGAIRGMLCGLTEQGEALVDFCGNTCGQPLVALTTVPVCSDDVGKEAVLFFEDGDPARPLLVGLIQPASSSTPRKAIDVVVDGNRLVLSAEQEIVLRCGESSITLTHEGKVLIKGSYLQSRSKGVNRIQGGSVQLN